MNQVPTLLALLPFLVKGAMSLRMLRAMRERGLEIAIAYTRTQSTLTPDAAVDFRERGELIDLSKMAADARRATLKREIRDRRVGLLLQIGAPSLYCDLPYLKEMQPRLHIVDTLYNEVGHVIDHFLYERCFSSVVVESQYMKRYVDASSALPSPNVQVVESGVDLTEFTPAARRPAASGLVVGYVGRMSPEKNPLGFVELCERLHAELPALSFRMIGEGPLADEVRCRVDKSSVRAALDYQGYQPDVVTVLRGLDVLIVPSKLDGRPTVVMEANACGTPVLAAPVGAIPELIEDGENGYQLRLDDAGRAIELLALWTSQPSLLARIRRTSRALAERQFDQRRMMDRYESVFRGHLRSSASP